MPNNGITKYCTPKTNLLACLDCGDYHEVGTICGSCYAKVKAETKALQDQMFASDEFQYQHPAKEVAFVYDTDEGTRERLDRAVIKVSRKRPDWFSDSLLTKISPK